MLNLLLSADETAVLRESLEQKQRELILELSHAHHAPFKVRLRHDLDLVERLLEKVEAAQVA